PCIACWPTESRSILPPARRPEQGEIESFGRVATPALPEAESPRRDEGQVRPLRTPWRYNHATVDWSAYPFPNPIRWRPWPSKLRADPVQKRVPGEWIDAIPRVDCLWPVTEGCAKVRARIAGPSTRTQQHRAHHPTADRSWCARRCVQSEWKDR